MFLGIRITFSSDCTTKSGFWGKFSISVVFGEAQLNILSKYDHYAVCLGETWKACSFMDNKMGSAP